MGKKSRKKVEDDPDEIANELEQMTIEHQNAAGAAKTDAKVNGVKPKALEKMVSKVSKAAKASDNESDGDEEEVVVRHKFGGFAALAGDDDDMMVDVGDDDDDDADSDDSDDAEPVISKPKLQPPAAKQTKKNKGKKAACADDDDDGWNELDTLVAPPTEQAQNRKKTKKDKRKGKKNKQEEDEEDFDKLLEEARLADGVTASLQEHHQETVEQPEELKSKKKKNKKKGKADVEEESILDNGQEQSPAPAATEVAAAEEVPADAAEEADADTAEKADANTAEADADTAEEADADTAEEADADTAEAAAASTAEVVASEADMAEVVASEADTVEVADADATTTTTEAAATEDYEATPSQLNDGKKSCDGSPMESNTPGADTPAEAADQPGKKTKRQKKKEADEERKRKKQVEDEKKQLEEEKKKAKKGLPNKKVLAAMRELQQRQKEEEEARRLEEEMLEKLEDDRIRKEEEQRKIDEAKKERKKLKERERKERLKAEGKLLTAKQKADQRRAQEMLEHLKAQGVSIPEAGMEKKAPRLGSKAYIRKKTQAKQEEKSPSLDEEEKVDDEKRESSEEKSTGTSAKRKEEDGIKDAWDASSEEEDDDSTSLQAQTSRDEDASNTAEDDSTGEQESSEEVEEEEPMTQREKIIARIKRRKDKNEKAKDINVLRAPVVCVLGHVDHGKTKILDKLRRTNVQEGEVGGITQQIGATNVPSSAIASMTKMIKTFSVDDLNFPGLLIIDTPGHESFSNLRNRGSSLCDIAILVVDITQGLEPQTLESIDLLKKRKTPFVVALNKVDRVFQWESNQHKDIQEVIKMQKEPAKNDFERRTTDIIVKLNEQGLNAALYYENPDPRSYVSLIPTSAITGDGMGNLLSMICDMCQNKLATQLRFSNELECIVLEVKTIQGHGTTIDVILVNGKLREGDSIVLAGTDGPIHTQIRSLLLPKPLKEIRVKGAYDEMKEVTAAQGVKVAAKDLEKAIAGLALRVANSDDEIALLKEAVDRDFSQAMKSIKVKDKGVYVQASTLGALEALLEFFKSKSIPYCGIRVGPVVKRDVMKAAAMLEHDEKYAVILAFDVKVEKDAQDLADKEGVKIFSEETIYHLGDRYVNYLDDYKKKKQEENKNLAIFPCKLQILPTAVFNKRDPIVLGVTVDQGVLRTGTMLCVPSKEFVEIGVVASMEFDHKPVDIAKKGVDICIKIYPAQGTTAKLYGRHFEAPDEIVSKISRESINACKEFFRDDLSKADWKLMAELKKMFDIL